MVIGLLKTSVFAFLVLAGTASAASTNDKQPPKIEDLLAQCGVRPVAPVVPAAATLDKAKLAVVKVDVKAFLADADKYQDCLAVVLEAPELSVMHKAQIVRTESQIQSEKEIIGGQYNEAVDAVNARLGGAPKPAAAVQPASTSASSSVPATAESAPAPATASPPARPSEAVVPKPKPAAPAQ